MMKRILSFLVAIIITCFSCSAVLAKNNEGTEGHYEDIEEVLFENGKYDKSKKEKVLMLEYASYLAIDQFGGNGTKQLDYLNKHGVKDTPKSIDDIDLKKVGTVSVNAKTHRNFTHRGWDWKYSNGEWQTKWKKRKKILSNTVDKVFNIKKSKQDSLCALIYYVHLLGDCSVDKWDEKNNVMSKKQGLKMPFARYHAEKGNEDILFEIIGHTKILFEDQENEKDYKELINKLEKLSKKSRKLVIKTSDTNNLNSKEQYDKYIKYVKNTLIILKKYFPKLLAKEGFFKRAF